MNVSETMKIVAFTRPDTFGSRNKVYSYDYQRVVALWHNDGIFGEHVGPKTNGLEQRELELDPVRGIRLLSSLRKIYAREEVNCHRFARDMRGMPSIRQEPILDFEALPRVDNLAVG